MQKRYHTCMGKKRVQELKTRKRCRCAVPEPYVVKRNILLMEFMGKDGIPMPQLKDIILAQDDADRLFKRSLNI